MKLYRIVYEWRGEGYVFPRSFHTLKAAQAGATQMRKDGWQGVRVERVR